MSLPFVNYLILSSMFILLSWAMYLPYRCGQLYLAPVYCMAAGAYFAGYASTAWNWPVGLALLVSPCVGALFAFVPALGLRRAPGFTVAISSMALIVVLQTVIQNLEFLGKSAGLFGIPPADHLLPITLGIVVVAGIFVYRIDHSRIGRAAEMIYYNWDMAASCGVNMSYITIFLQVSAGALSGVAGAILAFTLGALFPPAFGFSILLNVFLMVFVGGTFTMWGPVVFAPILWGIPLVLPKAIPKDLLYGVLLIVILILRPEGVITRSMVFRVKKMWIACMKGLFSPRPKSGGLVGDRQSR